MRNDHRPPYYQSSWQTELAVMDIWLRNQWKGNKLETYSYAVDACTRSSWGFSTVFLPSYRVVYLLSVLWKDSETLYLQQGAPTTI